MPQTTASKPVCSECGSEALGPALFCYHCGARLSVEKANDTEAQAPDTTMGADDQDDPVDRPIALPPGDPFEDAGSDEDQAEPTEENAVFEKARPDLDPGMTTASALRKNPELLRMRRVEVRWTPNESSPNIWFIIAAMALSLIVFGVFILSMVLR